MIQKTVTMDLGGVQATFFYDLKVAMQFEDQAGKNVKQFDITSPRDICTMCSVMFVRKKAFGPERPTVDEVSEMIHGGNLVDVQQALADVMGMKLIRTQQTTDGKPVSDAPEESPKN